MQCLKYTLQRIYAQARQNFKLGEGQTLDIDGDGVADMVVVDTTGDGNLDTAVQLDSAAHKLALAEERATDAAKSEQVRANVQNSAEVVKLLTDSVCARIDVISMCSVNVAEAREQLETVIRHAKAKLCTNTDA